MLQNANVGKYEKDGNDYKLLNHRDIKGIKIDTLDDTIKELNIIYMS